MDDVFYLWNTSSITVLRDRRWGHWTVFFIEIYTYNSSYEIYMYIPPFPAPQGRQERVDGGRQLWMTLPSFLGRFSFLIDKIIQKTNFIQVRLKYFKGEAQGLPWLQYGVKVLKKTEQSHVGLCSVVLLLLPVSYASWLDTTRHCCVLRVIVGPDTSLLGLTHRRGILISWLGPMCCLVGEFQVRAMGLRPRLVLAAVEFESPPYSLFETPPP